MKVRSVWPLLACVTVNEPFATVPMYMVRWPISVAAFAVFGNASTLAPAPQVGAVTTVLAAPAVSVNAPTAFERPSASWRTARTMRARSRSSAESVGPLMRLRLPNHGVVPANAGTHIPETPAWGTMGPRLRGDDTPQLETHIEFAALGRPRRGLARRS